MKKKQEFKKELQRKKLKKYDEEKEALELLVQLNRNTNRVSPNV